ncbi:MAG: PEP-CTERM sorting domain-containing protein [Betaproteobacteria bacterium]|nr:PEP-CTERM sorting domain-containing protein [Betaproteobacteria bacterium]
MSNVKSFTELISIIVLTASLMIWGQSVHATLVTTSFFGEVTFDNGGANPFGLSNGDSISGSATYDDALVAGISTDEQIFLNPNGWDFSVTLGSFSFTQATVTDPTHTSFFFNMGALDGLRFFLDPITVGSTGNIQIEDFGAAQKLFAEDADTANPIYLEATWDFPNATTVPVDPGTPMPVPGTLALLALGLIGFNIVKRRKNV